MAVSTSAAEAAVRASHSGTPDTGWVPSRGAFGHRQVTRTLTEAQGLPIQANGRALADNICDKAPARQFPGRTQAANSGSGRKAPHALSGLSAGLRMVSGVEQDIRRAKELLTASGIRILKPTEWDELSGLIASIQEHLTLVDDRWGHRPGRLPESRATGLPEDETVGESRRRLTDAYDYFYSDAVPWEDRIRRIGLYVPGCSGPVVVESRIVPGTALGACFQTGYPAEELNNPDSSARFRHVPDLEQTVLTGARGEVLYSGLRHSFILPDDLDGMQLNRLPDDELRVLIQNLCKPEYRSVFDIDVAIPSDTEFMISEIRNNIFAADFYASELSEGARHEMVRESFAAALVTDAGKFQRALGGATVELPLFVMPLLHDASGSASFGQLMAFFNSKPGTSLELRVRDPSGGRHTVNVKVGFRHFEFLMEGQHPLLTPLQRGQATRLLGPLAAEVPGGAVKDRIDAVRMRAGELKDDIRKLGPEHLQSVRRRGVDHPGASSAAHRLIGLTSELSRLEKNARALEQAARQLKRLLNENAGGAEDQRAAAARFALIAHLMGGIPLLSCASGTGFTRELDAEIKFLATVADSREGHLPPIGRGPGIWEHARGAFTPH